ncbi:MAG: IS5 family transposase [Deinococcota bacterium]
MKKKPNKYRIRNWSEYNAGLRQRGEITFWLDKAVVEGWLNKEKTGKRGASRTYSDVAIEAVVIIKSIFGLAGRQAVGLLSSIFKLMEVELAVPDPSTVSRRLANLAVELAVPAGKQARHVVIDATGIKVYGEGEWKTRQHGASKRRTWRKLHVAVDEHTGDILAAEVSGNDKKDSQLLEPLLTTVAHTSEITQVSADGAYDTRKCYETISKHHAKVAIALRKDAKIWQHGNCQQPAHPRDQNLRLIRKHGRKKWQRLVNYHRRSLAETTMFRFKVTFSPKAFSRLFDNQVAELKVKCKCLNKMLQLAKPESYLLT